MAKTMDRAKRVANGTYGSVWIDDEWLAECYGCQAKVEISSDTINLCGQFMEAYKATSGKGTGSLMLYKVDSGMLKRLEGIQDGKVPRCTVVTKLADPDSAGAERAALYDVMFTDLTLADWQAATTGKVTAPFTFSRYELLDAIAVE